MNNTAKTLITDEEVFSYYNKVLGQCIIHLRDQHDAEEVASTVMFKACQKKVFFKGNSLLSVWLFSIARNECNMLLRKRRQHQKIITEAEKIKPDKAVPAIYPDYFLINELEEIFQSLTKQQQKSLYYCQFTHSSNKQAAQKANVTIGALKASLRKAKKRFEILK